MPSEYTMKSSGLKVADAAIAARPARLHSVQVIGDGTNAATAIIYDNASAASGTVLAKIVVDAGATYEDWLSEVGVEALNGIYLDISGTGAEAVVHYSLL